MALTTLTLRREARDGRMYRRSEARTRTTGRQLYCIVAHAKTVCVQPHLAIIHVIAPCALLGDCGVAPCAWHRTVGFIAQYGIRRVCVDMESSRR